MELTIEQIKVGSKFRNSYGTEFKIMAVVDGYCMCRYKGCVPFVQSVKDLVKYLNTLTK